MKRYLIYVTAAFVAVQVALVLLLGGVPQVSDAKFYLNLAENAAAVHSWYPMVKDLQACYITAPAYINLLIAVKGIFGAILPFVLYLNIIFNVVLLFEMWYIAKTAFNGRTAGIAAVAYCLYLNNYGIMLYVFTEQMFCCLAYGSLCLVIAAANARPGTPGGGRRRIPFYAWAYAAGGLLMGLAHTVRPLTPAFVAGALLYVIAVRRPVLKEAAIYAAVVVMTIAAAGLLSYYRTGFYVSTATTGGLNFVIGANDGASGQWDNAVFNRGNIGYVPAGKTRTFRERDAYLEKQALGWVRHHPLAYVALMPKKIYYMFGFDSFCERVFSGDRNGVTVPQNRLHAALYESVRQYASVYYCILMLLGAAGMWRAARDNLAGGYALAAVMFAGIFMTLVVAYGMDRYRYPYMPIITIFAAYAVDRLAATLRRKQPAAAVS
jgi:hypothetical protein